MKRRRKKYNSTPYNLFIHNKQCILFHKSNNPHHGKFIHSEPNPDPDGCRYLFLARVPFEDFVYVRKKRQPSLQLNYILNGIIK